MRALTEKRENVCRFSSFLLLRAAVDPPGDVVGVGCKGRKDARHREAQFGTKLMGFRHLGHKLQVFSQERLNFDFSSLDH